MHDGTASAVKALILVYKGGGLLEVLKSAAAGHGREPKPISLGYQESHRQLHHQNHYNRGDFGQGGQQQQQLE